MKIILPLPPTLNATYRSSKGRYGTGRLRTYKIDKAKQWMKDAFIEIKKDAHHNRFGKKRCEMFIDIYYIREPDIDALQKPVLDVFEDALVYDNDRQVDDLHIHKEQVKSIPHMIVTIQPL